MGYETVAINAATGWAMLTPWLRRRKRTTFANPYKPASLTNVPPARH
jgi:hypothetical protein